MRSEGFISTRATERAHAPTKTDFMCGLASRLGQQFGESPQKNRARTCAQLCIWHIARQAHNHPSRVQVIATLDATTSLDVGWTAPSKWALAPVNPPRTRAAGHIARAKRKEGPDWRSFRRGAEESQGINRAPSMFPVKHHSEGVGACKNKRTLSKRWSREVTPIGGFPQCSRRQAIATESGTVRPKPRQNPRAFVGVTPNLLVADVGPRIPRTDFEKGTGSHIGDGTSGVRLGVGNFDWSPPKLSIGEFL